MVLAVDIDAGVEILSSGGGYVKFGANATATDVSLDSTGVVFTNLNMTDVIAVLTLNPEAGVNTTLANVGANHLQADAVGAGIFNASSAGRPIQNVIGAAAWSGTVLASVTPPVGGGLVTVLWSSGSGSLWIYFVAAALGLFYAVKRK